LSHASSETGNFAVGAVTCRDAFSGVSGEAGMVKTVEDVDGGPADWASGEGVFKDMVAEQEHELLGFERGDVRMELQEIAVTLNRDAPPEGADASVANTWNISWRA
jgi:hypothetical protein